MMGTWASFGSSGNPNSRSPLNGSLPFLEWPLFGRPGEEQYYVFDHSLSTVTDLKATECDLWDTIPKEISGARFPQTLEGWKAAYRYAKSVVEQQQQQRGNMGEAKAVVE